MLAADSREERTLGFGDLSSKIFGFPLFIKISNKDMVIDSTSPENKALARLVNCWTGDNKYLDNYSFR